MGRTPAFEKSRDFVQSLARGLAVLRAFDGEHAALNIAGIAARARMSRAAARRLILTLEHLGYVRASGRDYTLGPRVLELGFGYIGSHRLTDVAQPLLEALAHRIQFSCSLAVLDGQSIVYVLRVPVQRLMTVALGAGARLPAYCASMGRVLLAGLAPPEAAAWIEACRPVAHTQHTITDPRRLQQLIEAARSQGHAYVEQELELGLCSIAVPVLDRDARVIAALNASMPFHDDVRRQALGRVLPELRSTAAELRHALPPHALPPVAA